MLSAQSQPQLSKGVALITGAARGIGRGIALRLADDGFDVAVNDLPGTPELDEVIETIVNKGRRAIATPGDVSDESAVVDMIQSTVQTLGSLDVVRFSFFQQPPLISNPFSPFLSRLDVPARHGLLNTCCIDSAYMQMVANAGLVILEPFLESEYYGATPRIRRAYVPHFSNVTASVAAFDKQMAVNARGTMLCYKYAAKQMIAQGRGGRIIGAYGLVSNVCA